MQGYLGIKRQKRPPKNRGQLVLTRGLGQSIMIGGDGEITIKVLRIEEDTVRLGIKAAEDIPIDREEIFISKKSEGL